MNFNYTKTADLYLPANSDIPVNHIHGELDNEQNPVIFGYGDELDEDYKTISNLNDNSYLTNIGKHGKIDPVGTDEIDPVKTA